MPPDNAPPDNALLARYLAGDISEADRGAVDSWLALDPANRDALERARRLWDAVPVGPAFGTEAAWHAVHERMSAARSPRARVRAWARWGRVSRARRVAWGVAGVATAAAALVAVRVETLRTSRSAAATSGQAYATVAGQRATITLPDGTEIMLGPASRLLLGPDFGVGRREAALDGEALFTVVHDARRPFRVRAGNALTTDVGTQFDIRAYPTDSVVRVVVKEGSVALGSASATAQRSRPPHINAGESATMTASGQVGALEHVDPDVVIGWTTGRLVFANAPLPIVLADLSRWYGVDIAVTDPTLRARDVTITLERLPLETALALVAPAVGAHVIREGSTYTLRAAAGSRDHQPGVSE